MAGAGEPDRGSAFARATVAMRHREFAIFWVAALVSNTGSWMQAAAIPYVAFQLTGRNGGVGLTGFWQYLPVMMMGAIGGSMADRFERKRLLVATQIAQAICALMLWWLVASGRATPTTLTALAFTSGLAGGMNIPVWQSFVSQLVPREILMNAVTLNSTQFNAARALGTFAAGIVIATSGPDLVFAINALSFGSVLIGLAFIRSQHPAPIEGKRLSAGADLAAGVRYVWSVPGIVSCCIAIVAIAGIASPLFSFITSSYTKEIFHVSGWQQGLLWGAGGIGSLVFAPFILTIGARLNRSILLVGAMTAHATGTIIVGSSPRWWLAAVGLMLYGGSYLAIASALNTTIQLLARDDMRGKSIAVFVMCLTGALPIGLYVWGVAADHLGIQEVTVIAGVLLLLVTAGLWVTGRFSAMTDADRSLTTV